MRFESVLGRTVHGFWATSYAFDLRLFDQYLLRRIAQTAINAVVLVDHDKLASVWEHLGEGETYLLRQVGRRYLLRGVRLPGSGAFHPKSYLLTQKGHATLVVGSGNLTRDGIDYGHETFTAFRSDRDADLPSMRTWARWLGEIVQMQSDDLLTERWTALREDCPWMLGEVGGSHLLTNESRPLADQWSDHVPESVRELHIAAPFFDRDASAVGQLIAASDPGLIVLYMGAEPQVDGRALRAALDGRSVRVRSFQPHVFVHAKLIGVVGENGHGVILSGSPNLSRAALALTMVERGGNCELAVIRSGSGEQVRAVFEGSRLDLADAPLDSVLDLDFPDDDESELLQRPITLRTASWREDGRVELSCVPPTLPPDARILWDGADFPAAVGDDQVTHDVLSAREPVPQLVALHDQAGTRISNWAIVDDPAALSNALRETTTRDERRPPELEGIEMLPLVRLVLWAHDKFIFDPDDSAAFRRAQDAAAEVEGAGDTSAFWERYAAEELQYDPRTRTYKPLTSTNEAEQPVDELLRELEALLHGAPGMSPDRLLRVITGGKDEPETEHEPGARWSMEARQRVRAYHLLTRWATALADPRHALIDPLAPVLNYETLLGLTFVAWITDALDVAQARRLLRTVLDAFIGPSPGHGFLGRASHDEQQQAVTSIEPGFVEIGAGLVHAALHVANWQDDIYDWQPALSRGMDLKVLQPGALTASAALQLTGKPVESTIVERSLIERAKWIDDATWCKRLAAELELPFVGLERFNNPKVSISARIGGALNFLHDPRVCTVARRVSAYKHSDAVAVFAGDDRLIFIPDEVARITLGGATGVRYTTDQPVDLERLKAVEEQGGAIADLFSLGAHEVAA